MKIEKSLKKLYNKHRIIVWYDPEQSFTEELVDFAMSNISVIKISNDELAVKYRILHQEPKQKFLLYMPYARPADEDNWLLDIELSQHIFQTNQEVMLLQELELPLALQNWIKRNQSFFRSKERTTKFKQLVVPSDSDVVLNNKLIQVLFGSNSSHIDDLLRDYTQAFVEESVKEYESSLLKYDLSNHFWEQIMNQYGIDNPSQQLYDFLLQLFKYSFRPLCGESQVLNSAKVALSRWKDLRSFHKTYDALSHRISEDLQIRQLLDSLVLEDLLEDDLFESIEKWIIKDLVQKAVDRTYNIPRIQEVIKKRLSKHWFEKYKSYYSAIEKAVSLIDLVEEIDLKGIDTLADGFNLYTQAYYKVDQLYRQFIELLRQVERGSVLQSLYIEIERLYTNKWLLELSEQWQYTIEKEKDWYLGDKSQFNFYQKDVKRKYLDHNRKVFVIISDALRYEIGQELHDAINQRNRFKSVLDYLVTGLPSYTQLGMASLLPHERLSFGDGDDIYIDGLATKGLAPRKKILTDIGKVSATTISAEELASYKVKSEEAKALVQNHDVVYVYHNIIDKMGDDKVTEEKVFDAGRDEIEHLLKLIQRITSFNISHILITADHGFIYQHDSIDESDFIDAQISGTISKSNRRFVIGHDLSYNNTVLKFDARDVGIHSDATVLIPKGMNRMRRQGAGSRFVHGGASLQETVVPLLYVSKLREDTLNQVSVDIINKSNNRITTNIHPIKFYQSEAISSRLVGRQLKAYFGIEENGKTQVISDVFQHIFDSEMSRAEDREVSYTFKFSTTIQRHQNVWLFVEEQIAESTQWKPYNQYKFTLSLGMMNDFDDF